MDRGSAKINEYYGVSITRGPSRQACTFLMQTDVKYFDMDMHVGVQDLKNSLPMTPSQHCGKRSKVSVPFVYIIQQGTLPQFPHKSVTLIHDHKQYHRQHHCPTLPL